MGAVSKVSQRSRSVVSAALQVGEQIEGAGVWRALSGSGTSDGGGTVGLDVAGKVAPHAVTSSGSAVSVSHEAARFAGVGFGDGEQVFTVVPFEGAVAFCQLARLALAACGGGVELCDGLRVVALGSGQAQGLLPSQQGQGRAQSGEQARHGCSSMHWACRRCWRSHTPLQPFGPQLAGSRQSRPA